MSFSRVLALAVLALGPAHTAFAQSGELALPREFPPASYSSNQYVDSTGCAFLRAGLSGTVTWVPRVNRDRTQLCGFQPSIVSVDMTIAENAAAIANAPVISIDVPAATPMATAAADMADVGMPIETVASLTTPPRVPAVQPVSPRIIEVPTPVSAPVISPAIPHMTMAQICADMDATGHRYMNAETGIPVRCGPQLQPVSTGAAGVAQVSARAMVNLGGQIMTVAQLCQISDATGNRYLNAATGIPVRCGPQIQSPSGLTAPLGQQLVTQAPIAPVAIPYPAPVAAQIATAVSAPNRMQPPVVIAPAAVIMPPAGYVPVWDDGRLNPHRGLPEGNAQAVVAPVTTQVSAMNLPQPAATGHRFVQVGTFADPANADRTAARLQALGLPVGFATMTRNGTQMRIVVAGPFVDVASLQAALLAARSAGFTDAFTRN